MAEFKLGRIRFVFKSDWTTATVYYKDDIVRAGGSTYVCIAGHTSSPQFLQNADKWNKMSDGQKWRGDWATSTLYYVDDIVKYGGYLYIANGEHTSAATATAGLEGNQLSWDLFAEGFDYKADWAISTRYKINDIVKYGAVVYLCTDDHTSNSDLAIGLEVDIAKWDVFSSSFDWKNDWVVNTRYKRNDIIRYGGQLYVSILGHTSAATLAEGLESNQSSWEYLHKGIVYLGDWTYTPTRYRINDVVKWGGGLWICTTYHTSTFEFETDESNWAIFVPGLEFEDSWENDTRYQPGDIVSYGGYTYVSKTIHRFSKPTLSPDDWELFNTGFKFLGDWADDSSDHAYEVGDVVRLNGYTYICTADNFNNPPPNLLYWDKLNSGFFWKDAWANSTIYQLGDVVSTGVNSYVCVQGHTSDEVSAQNRPDQDTDGDYWNTMSGGPEVSVITTAGDLVFYGGAGPARLPIGTAGQVLTVNAAANAPEWSYLGSVNHVFYVETNNGVDSPAPVFGGTIDQPWKTIRYAAEQIEKGPLRPNSSHLLTLNKSFIQAETVEWVDYQIAQEIAPFTASFTYTKETCRRDVGLIVDAVNYDLTHGGNEKSRAAALSYFNGNALIAAIADEDGETAAALVYTVTVMNAVLQQLTPAANYQTLNSVATPIVQYTNAAYPEEADARAQGAALVQITSNALTAAVPTNIPVEIQVNSTINVKTGQFNEILPIIIPKNTAVVGDELRSTKIVAGGSFVAGGDVTYSMAAITHLASFIDNVIENNTAGWTKNTSLTQVVTRPAGSSAAGTAAAAIVTDIKEYIDFKINAAGTEPTLAGTNTPVATTGFTYAIEVLEANRLFIIDEVIEFITATYPSYVYEEASCRRDVDRYINAVQYDLNYTGNYKSLLAARYYVNAVSGSTLEDMFYARNGTGLRNCTISGLNGTLGSANAYGTKRPSAGAYVSLDPGWGTTDSRVWITNKSPYVQNVTTFGTGCVGLKIDGDLHAGGNDSVVANDFTQVLSDGIGVWCTNLARTELVSVFSYYGHIGYLAETGGKIRATNGNSSYGAFGTVSEGVDSTETPITGTVDNFSTDAIVQSVFTNGDEILQFEYLNAGVGYTTSTTAITVVGTIGAADALRTVGSYNSVVGTSNGGGTGQEFDIAIEAGGLVNTLKIVKGGTGHTQGDIITIADSDLGSGGAANLTFVASQVGAATVFTVSGDGTGAVINSPVVNDGAVYQIRLMDPSENQGGADYVSASNYSQTGNATQITLSNTDTNTSAAFVGMAVYILTGLGAGQYGYVHTYNSGTKIATIKKMSDGTDGWDHLTGAAISATLDDSTAYLIEPRLTFNTPPSGLYADTAKARARVEGGKIVEIRITDPGSGYTSLPTLTITDPSNTAEAPTLVRYGDGVLAQPTWTNRGSGYSLASAVPTGDGYANQYQIGSYVQVEGLTSVPLAGSNVEIAGISNVYYKLVTVRNLLGTGPYSALLQLSPAVGVTDSPEHAEGISIRYRYSQCRLTGHDFLDIGTGNFADTNYPGIPNNAPIPANETFERGGGRVFYTSTDQDGNFRVGELFSVEQSTGIATLDADAFNISGLQELQLGSVSLGGTSALITEFSADGTFASDSDNILPTQRAIKTYITSQIGGGAATLNVNSITAGQVKIIGTEITTPTGVTIDVTAPMNFTVGVNGYPQAWNYFLS